VSGGEYEARVTDAITACSEMHNAHSRSIDGLFDAVLSLYRWVMGLLVALLLLSCAFVVAVLR
jgi:hypothetical protein